MIFRGSKRYADIKGRTVQHIKFRVCLSRYITLLSSTFIPDINLLMSAQCDIGLYRNIHVD